jgi:hypothetical protein
MATDSDSLSTGWLLFYVLLAIGITYGALAYVGAPI